jgi:hypothetical protein
MEATTLIWMILMLGAIIGPFLYFANLANSKEKTKVEE